MSIPNISEQELREAFINSERVTEQLSNVQLLFVPTHINPENPEELTSIYKNIDDQDFDTVVIIESYKGMLDKKLSIPSNISFSTPFGEVWVDDQIRNELCDEEDDFYIDDGGISDKMSLYTQLMMLQLAEKSFKVVSIQIGDYDPAIVKELAFALDEIFRGRKALLIFCCDLPNSKQEELKEIEQLIKTNNESGLHHYLNRNDKQVEGARAFMTGILIAKFWDLSIWFTPVNDKSKYVGGFAYVPNQESVAK